MHRIDAVKSQTRKQEDAAFQREIAGILGFGQAKDGSFEAICSQKHLYSFSGCYAFVFQPILDGSHIIHRSTSR